MKKLVAAVTVACTLSSGAAWAADGEMVLLVDMAYTQGRWVAKPSAVLPCGGPSKPDSPSATRSLYQLKSRDGKVLLGRYIENPRLILVEDPREPTELLKETKFTLRVPINQARSDTFALEDVQAFEFFENGRELQKPSALVNVSLANLAAATGGSARCTVVDPSRDRLPPLTVPANDAISPDTLTTLIEKDRESLIRFGLDNDVTPTQLRTLVSRNEKQLAEARLDKAATEKLLQEYEAAYRNRRR